MKAPTLLAVFMLLTIHLVAQNDNASLLAQSPDGKTVQLVWFFKNWSSDITGFDIKRKDGIAGWVKLNTEPILPGLSAHKKLSIVEADKLRESTIRARILKRIARHEVEEVSYNDYLQRLNGGPKAVQDMMKPMKQDYDLALASGFGFVDHTATKKTGYQYGLFIAGTDRQLASVHWNYGEIPDLNVVREITSRSNTATKGITVIWDADTERMAAANVAGFNIYREGIRLNASPVTANNEKNTPAFSWYDKSAAGNLPTDYSISAESAFGIEGLIRPYTYNPADHPAAYKKAAVTYISSLGFYMKDGIEVKWNFPREYEHFIKGFYVEKDNMPKGYERVSGLLGATERGFTDKTHSTVNGYIRYRIAALYNDRTEMPGVEKIYTYLPVGAPPPPQNVKAKTMIGNKKDAVSLSWEMPMAGDSLTEYYKAYGMAPQTENFAVLAGGEHITGNKYTFVTDATVPGVYKFCVSALGRNDAESPMSDTVFVQLGGMEQGNK